MHKFGPDIGSLFSSILRVNAVGKLCLRVFVCNSHRVYYALCYVLSGNMSVFFFYCMVSERIQACLVNVLDTKSL